MSTTFLEPDFSNQISRTTFLEPLFFTFLEKGLQIKWSTGIFLTNIFSYSVICKATDAIFLREHVLLWVCVNDADNNPFRKLLIRKKALSILRTRWWWSEEIALFVVEFLAECAKSEKSVKTFWLKVWFVFVEMKRCPVFKRQKIFKLPYFLI